jgi:hypothetical protein
MRESGSNLAASIFILHFLVKLDPSPQTSSLSSTLGKARTIAAEMEGWSKDLN